MKSHKNSRKVSAIQQVDEEERAFILPGDGGHQLLSRFQLTACAGHDQVEQARGAWADLRTFGHAARDIHQPEQGLQGALALKPT
jgi:hypothetical protein